MLISEHVSFDQGFDPVPTIWLVTHVWREWKTAVLGAVYPRLFFRFQKNWCHSKKVICWNFEELDIALVYSLFIFCVSKNPCFAALGGLCRRRSNRTCEKQNQWTKGRPKSIHFFRTFLSTGVLPCRAVRSVSNRSRLRVHTLADLRVHGKLIMRWMPAANPIILTKLLNSQSQR